MSDNDTPNTETKWITEAMMWKESWQSVTDAIESRANELEEKIAELSARIDELEG